MLTWRDYPRETNVTTRGPCKWKRDAEKVGEMKSGLKRDVTAAVLV